MEKAGCAAASYSGGEKITGLPPICATCKKMRDDKSYWKQIETSIRRNYMKKTAADRRPAYPGLPLFKMLLIHRWYNLSDPALEAAMCDRISFLGFEGFSLEDPVPLKPPFIHFVTH